MKDNKDNQQDTELRASIEVIIESTTDDVSTKDLVTLMDKFETFVKQDRERAERLAWIDELQLLIGTHNNDPSVDDYSVVKVTRSLLNDRIAALQGKEKHE